MMGVGEGLVFGSLPHWHLIREVEEAPEAGSVPANTGASGEAMVLGCKPCDETGHSVNCTFSRASVTSQEESGTCLAEPGGEVERPGAGLPVCACTGRRGLSAGP